MLDFLYELELPWMLAVTLGLVTAYSIIIIIALRLLLRRLGIGTAAPLPISAPIMTGVGAMFALMLAFSAAGIWTDVLQARSAVQREANALENVFALANALSPELRDTVKNGVVNYAEGVVARDWPAMVRKVPIGDPVYGNSDRVLVALIDYLSGVIAQGNAPSIMPALLGQLFEARSARITRLTLAGSGLSWAQWTALIVLITVVLVVVAMLHHHARGLQFVAVGFYAVAGAAFFFVILAHDRPFVRESSVSPWPLIDLANKTLH